MNKKTLANELVKVAKMLVGIEFQTEEEKKKYEQEHDVKPGTKLEVVKEEKGEGKKEESKQEKKPEGKKSKLSDEDRMKWLEEASDGVKSSRTKALKSVPKSARNIVEGLVKGLSNLSDSETTGDDLVAKAKKYNYDGAVKKALGAHHQYHTEMANASKEIAGESAYGKRESDKHSNMAKKVKKLIDSL